MLTALDHLEIGVADLDDAVETYRNLGFTVTTGRVAAQNREAVYVFFGDFYLEFRDFGDVGDHKTRIVYRTHDLHDEVARLRSNGFAVSDPVEHPGASPPCRTVVVDSDTAVGLVECLTPHDRPSFAGINPHPNTVTELERIYIAVDSIEAALGRYEELLGIPAPGPEMGTVIMSLMSVFYIGGIGIAVAEPRGPGPTADALAANGPGLFQALFRAEHLDQAASLMVENGLPAPRRGTRLSGESALLVDPANACNMYIALAGQP